MPDHMSEICRRNDITGLIGRRIPLRSVGSMYIGKCPFHEGGKESFLVSPKEQIYCCMECGAGGNAFSFLMEYEGVSAGEAASMLAKRAGIEWAGMPRRQAESDGCSSYLICKEAARFYHAQLMGGDGKEAREYLNGRGLDEDDMRLYGLGASPKDPDALCDYLMKSGFDPVEIHKAGLLDRWMSDRMKGRAVFPITDENSRVIGFGGRDLSGESKAKYLNTPETEIFRKRECFYGTGWMEGTDVILCEGYMDAIALHKAGFPNTAATLGTVLTLEHAIKLKRRFKRAILCYDSDDAGKKAALLAVRTLRNAGIESVVVSMRPYKDPDELIREEGADELRSRMEHAQDGIVFEARMLPVLFLAHIPERHPSFICEAAERLSEMTKESDREEFLSEITKEGICEREEVMEALERILPPASQRRKEQDAAHPEALEESVLSMLEAEPCLCEKAFKKGRLLPEDFTGKERKTRAWKLFGQRDRGCGESKNEDELLSAIYKMKEAVLMKRTKELPVTDIAGFKRLVNERRSLEKQENI